MKNNAVKSSKGDTSPEPPNDPAPPPAGRELSRTGMVLVASGVVAMLAILILSELLRH